MSKKTVNKLLSVPLLVTTLTLLGCAQIDKSSYQGIGTESVTPEVLKKFAPTPIPQDLSRKIQNYLDIRSPGLGMLTPDGKSLFFTWRVTGSSQIWKVKGPNQFPEQITGGEDQTFLAGITKDGKFLIVSRDRAGEENPGLYLQSVEGGNLEAIQHLPKIQTSYQGQSKDGEFIFFRSNDKSPDSYTIYRYSLKTKIKELLFSEKGFWVVKDIGHDGENLLLGKIFSNNHNEVYHYNIKTKENKPLLGQALQFEYQVAFSHLPNSYFVITPQFSNFRKLYLYNNSQKNNQWQNISPELKGDVTDLLIDEDRTKLIYSTNLDGYSKFTVLNAQTLKEIKIKIPESADHAFSGWISRDGQKMTVGIETGKAPKSNYIYDFQSKKLTSWVIPSSPEVNTSNFSRASLEYYPAQDGTQIPMFVRRPPHCQAGKEFNCPVIVHFHGGPEAQSTPGFSVFSQIFVDAGFIFVDPNVRGSDGYGQIWLNSDNGANRLKVISDIEDAAKFVRSQWKVKKIGVMGGSYGGYSTFYAMTKFAGSYDAGVETVGMSNLHSFLMNTAPYRRALRIAEYGDPEMDKAALMELSPITHIDKIKAPLMMIQGVNDPRVPAGEGHGTGKRTNQVIQLGKTLQFFEKHLKN